jgi:DNA-3-methyladenine glycosylase II
MSQRNPRAGIETKTPRAAAVKDAVARTASLAEAAAILAGGDPVIARLVEEAGPPVLSRLQGSHFAALVRAIVGQQLAEGAAAAIFARLVVALGGTVEAGRLQVLSDEQLRAVGLSHAKVASVRDLAGKVLDGSLVLSGPSLSRLSDAEVETRLRRVRGIGPWTAQVFMMFRLGRVDIWPTGDLGVRRGYARGWGVPVPSSKQLDRLGEPYRPYRTVLTWCCWKADELYGHIQK